MVFNPVDGRAPASTVVLTVDEAEAFGGRLGADAVAAIEPRLDLVNAQLAVAGFTPLRPASVTDLRLAARDDTLELGGRRVDAESFPRPAGCTPTLDAAWESDAHDVVVELGGCAAGFHVLRAGGAQAASVLNTRAMRKLKAKDWTGAAADFRAAIDLHSQHVKARYNLACLASLTGDRATALEQLRWLAASDLPEASAKLVKARTDPDLRAIRGDPDVQAILARSVK